MKTHYKIVYTIVDGEKEEVASIGVLGLDEVPQVEGCVELAMRACFPNYAVGVAMKFYEENGYVFLLDDDREVTDRIITNIGYALDC